MSMVLNMSINTLVGFISSYSTRYFTASYLEPLTSPKSQITTSPIRSPFPYIHMKPIRP